MIPINNDYQDNKKNILGIIIIFFAGLLIIFLTIVFYMIATDSLPDFVKNYFVPKIEDIKNEPKSLTLKVKDSLDVETADAKKTNIIKYVFPLLLPEKIKDGSCSSGSLSQPFRKDAFRCSVDNLTYDPCFSNFEKDKVVCQMNPQNDNDIFLINLQKKLPEIKTPEIIKNNWAWFIELEDGTICSPYTSDKPVIDNQTAFYGCKAKVKGDLDVLIGDLIIGDIWKVKRVIVKKDNQGIGWETKFSKEVNLKTIWQ